MSVQTTVVFADLFGSTGVFESLGNARATELVTQATSWIAQRFTEHGGKVVKFLGDGVLVVFADSMKAIHAVIDLQRSYQQLIIRMPPKAYMPLRVGVAHGGVETVADDCYGDAVNIAARLSELTGPHQIWANAESVERGFAMPDTRFRPLGPIHIRGRAEACKVYQVEWQDDQDTALLTVHAGFEASTQVRGRDALGIQIELSWDQQHKIFQAFDLPVHIGRMQQLECVVSDARVSRTHARIEWRNGSVVLVDLSTYGCWVRFAGGGADLLLRREECVLHGRGAIALGTPFGDRSAPVVTFSVF